jgi:hypothetical protein
MANKFQIKRTAVSGRSPNTTSSSNNSYIDAGELAINMTDGKLFSSNGTLSFEVGANLSSLSVTGNTTIGDTLVLSANGITFSDNTTITTAPSGTDAIVYAIALG